MNESIAAKLIRQRVRALMRETPGDAQYVELMGSLRPLDHMKLMKRHTIEVDVPIHVKAYNAVNDDIDNSGLHTLIIDIDDPDVSWAPADRTVGIERSPEAGNGSTWYVIGIDSYSLEGSDGDRIKAWLRSRPDVMGYIEQEIMSAIEEKESLEDPPEKGGGEY